MNHTPGTWYVRQPSGRRARLKVGAPGEKSVCTVRSTADAHLISAAPELLLLARVVAALPIAMDSWRDDTPVFGIDGRYITVGDVRAARRAVEKADGKSQI